MALPLFQPIAFVGGIAIGTGVGSGIAGVVEPTVQDLRNEAWQNHPARPLEAVQVAELVATGERSMAWAIPEAANQGVNVERLQALVDVLDAAPDITTLVDLRRRRFIGDGEFRAGVKKAGIEDEWIDPLVLTLDRILSPAEAAQARQRGYMTEGEQLAEAALSGVSEERAQIQFESAGLPPPPETAMQMLRRGVIDSGEFEQMIREGNTKTKYTDEYLALRERRLTGQEWAGLRLRGWVTEAQAQAGGAEEGWSAEDMERLYLNRGRPATTRQVHIGYARGGSLPGAANEREAFEKAVAQSNVRTEYTDLLWAQRHSYPSAFVVRALTQAGTFDRDTAENILIESGWPPQYATLAADSWAGASGAGPGTKWADRARTRVFTEAWSDYLDGNSDEAELRAMLQAIGTPGAEQDTIVTLANVARTRSRRDLTQAQVLKLYRKGIWTREQAQLALEDLGMDAGDASDLLDAQ